MSVSSATFGRFSVQPTRVRATSLPRRQPVWETLEGRRLVSASVAGVVYNDLNAAGTVKPGDTAVAGVRVYVDLGNHNAYTSGDPTAISDSLGEYSINGLAAGSYILREVIPAQYRQTEPSNGAGHALTLTSSTHLTNIDFGDTQKVRVSGYVFNDSNGDASQNHGEGIVSGVTVYLDANGNKKLDSGEMHTTTNSTGYWVIGDLPPGKTYTVRVVTPTGDIQTDPKTNGAHVATLQKGQTADNLLFGVRPATVVFNSQSRSAFASAGSVPQTNTSYSLGVFDTTATVKSSTLGDTGTANLTSSITANTITALGSLSTVQTHNTAEAVDEVFVTFTLSAATAYSTGYDIFGNNFSFSLQKLGANSSYIIKNASTDDPSVTSYAFSKSGTLAAGQYMMSFEAFQVNNPGFLTKSFVMNFGI
ncbi:MAG TPA: SdrD B-like domain-containing protein [Tepidisphaeraceae bacterium]|jgi:hypothetical protein|nr:SdrD B-like domain-containing protein [Tepidisphaeraceae bacterium]